MIRPSRLQRREGARKGPQLHQRLSAQRRRTLQLTVGAVAACAVSLLCWLLAVPSLWHLAATLVAFGLGAGAALRLEPLRRAGRWALEWIAARSGLSYQTALELEDEDRYGLAEAVRERAAAQVMRLEPPTPSAWWLPPLVAALLLALLPVTPFRGANRALPFLPQTAGSAPADRADGLEAAEPEPPAAASEPETAPSGLPDEPAPGAPATLDGVQSSGQADDGAASGRATDDAALQAFLQALEEAGPPPEPEMTNPFRSVQQQEGSVPPNDEARGEPQRGQQPGEASAEQGGGEPGEPQDAGAEQASGGPSGEPGDEAGQQGEDGAPGESEAQAGGEQQPEAGDQQGAPQGASAEPAPAPGEGQAMEAGQRGDDEASMSEGGADAGAGRSIGLTGEPDAGLGGPQGDPDLLQGQRGEGPSSLAGTIRLPGAPGSDALPGGGAASGFERSAEQAIQEGRIPLEYQEIVRNYFQ